MDFEGNGREGKKKFRRSHAELVAAKTLALRRAEEVVHARRLALDLAHSWESSAKKGHREKYLGRALLALGPRGVPPRVRAALAAQLRALGVPEARRALVAEWVPEWAESVLPTLPVLPGLEE